MISNGELLWSVAFFLVSVCAVAIGYYEDVLIAFVFWIVAVAMLMALRPE